MDDARFDRFTRAIAGLTSRRGLLGVAASLPVAGGGFALLDPADIEARKRDRKDRDRNDGRDEVQDEKKKKKKATLCLNGQTIRVSKKKKKKFLRQGATPGACPPCVPDAKTTTCNGKCGSQINNCQQTVDCGSCDCNPPCGECFACEGTPGACVPKDAGAACGAGPTCSNDIEHLQDTCDGSGTCQPGQDRPCQPYFCAGNACATTCINDNDCDSNAYCNQTTGVCTQKGDNGESCQGANECFSDACCNNVCRQCCDNNDCLELNPSTPICLSNVCVGCATSPDDCPGGTCCNANTQECVADCPGTQLCWPDNICAAPCSDSNPCNADELCVEGICRECTVFNGQNLQTAITNAEAGATLYVCPGSYTGDFGQIEITKSITIIGAGDGAGETALFGPVVVNEAGTQLEPVILRDMRILPSGFGISQIGGNLRMERCTVRGGAAQGVGVDNNGGVLEMRRCDVIDCTTGASGAGVRNLNGAVILRNCRIEGNTAQSATGISTGNNAPDQSSSLELHNTEVRGNTANGGTPTGAGILKFGSASTVTISNDSVICDNDPVVDQCFGLVDDSQCSATCPA